MTDVIAVTKRVHAMETLDDLLLRAVDKALQRVFRETGTKVIFDFLGNNSHFRREEIAEKPEVFSTGLKKLLGSGATVIERLVLKDLYPRLDLRFKEKEGYEFSDYVEELRKRFEGGRGLMEEG